jgi:hypothetical protein
MSVQAKMKCFTVQHLKDGQPDSSLADIRLMAVYDDNDPTNKSWSKATPSANLNMYVTVPEAIAYFEPGAQYTVTFTKVS